MGKENPGKLRFSYKKNHFDVAIKKHSREIKPN